MPVEITDLQLIIFMLAIVLFGGIILIIMYDMFKCIFNKFNELRKRLWVGRCIISGGYFEYQQYRLGQMADELEDAIYRNENPEEGSWTSYELDGNTINEFKNAIKALRVAQVYVHEIDYILSGDTGEERFHERLTIKLNALNNTVSNQDNS